MDGHSGCLGQYFFFFNAQWIHLKNRGFFINLLWSYLNVNYLTLKPYVLRGPVAPFHFFISGSHIATLSTYTQRT